MFWTMDDSDGLPEVTMCEEHALSATNYGMALSGDHGFGSMAEAYAILSGLAATVGLDLGMTSNEIGPCDQCEWEDRHPELPKRPKQKPVDAA